MFVHRGPAVNRSGVTASSRLLPVPTQVRSALAPVASRPLLREAAVLVLVVAVAVLVLRGPSDSQGFSIDESRWIATSRYFWITFVDRDLFGPAWQPNYLVYTHPPVARYVIGFGLWLQGWAPEQLNGRYDSLQSRAYNERAGNVPDLDLLWAARRVTLVFAVGSVALVYAVARRLGGRPAGLAAAGLALLNPLLTTVWTRALAESIVATFSLLALALALHAMPKVGTPTFKSWLPPLIGVALALAAATKLNGALGALGLGAYAMVQQLLALHRTRRTIGLRSWIDVGLAAAIVFVAVNPLLYVNPANRVVGLIQHRQDEMQFQRSVFSVQAVPEDLQSRISRVAWRTFDSYATPRGPLPLPIDLVLVPLGLLALAWSASVALRQGMAGPALLFLCWLAATYAVITPNLGFDSSHYFAPLVVLNVVTMGVGIAVLARALVRRIARFQWRAVPVPDQNIQAPTT
ncbi:MAG TPA: phospholipid carrier-dependent glycosyltransferase [Chloroflexota bacterium]|nr:phospholipid carrier-dependent glycosyltransferase [Chloroflexota bacterium]